MKKVSASIDVCSANYSLSELCEITGLTAGSSSHDKGSPRGRRGTWAESTLRIESEVAPDGDVSDHLNNLLSRFERLALQERIEKNQAIKTYLNVAVMFNTANLSLLIDDRQLMAIGRCGMKLEITAYPSQGDSGDSPPSAIPGISTFNLKPSAIERGNP